MKLNKENLYNEYIINNKTQEECMNIFNVSIYYLKKCLNEYGINKSNNYNHLFLKYQKNINDILGDDYVLLKINVGKDKKILLNHKKCGNTYLCSYKHIAESVGCLNCYKESKEIINAEQLKELYLNENLNVYEIAKKVNCHRSIIYRLIKKYNLIKKESQLLDCKNRRLQKSVENRKKIDFDKEKVISMLEKGLSEKEISEFYKCSKSRVNNYVQEERLGKYKNIDLRNERQLGKTKTTIYSKYGVTNVMSVPEIRQKAMENNFHYNISKPEIELKEYISSIYDGKISRYRDAFYELDIYIPDKKVGIEYNGNYWHSSLHKDKNYHYDKSSYFEEKGIRVIHIFEYEWDNERQRPILENIIKNALGINQEKIYARKCSIEVRKSSEMKNFFNQNNIQGFRGGKFAICLIYQNEIVMSYIMGHCYFGKGKYQWEVIRGATKLGINVIGGASRIWKYFLKEYNPNNCVYYIDYNYFNGSSLPYLGLKYIKSQPGFKNWWVKDNKVKNREPERHKEISKLYETGEVIPIYNAGTKVYVWENLNFESGSF